MSDEQQHPAGDRERVLVVANKTCPCPELHRRIEQLASGPDSEVLVVAPALNSRVRHWVSDVDEATSKAEARLAQAVEDLGQRGLRAFGEVGDADPVQAVDDALHDFEASEIVVSTHPPEHSTWLERNIVERVRDRHDLPVTHVVSGYGLDGSDGADD